MVFGQGGAAGGHRPGDAGAEEGDHVGVALADHGLRPGHDVGLGPVETVEDAALLVDGRLRRVLVLGPALQGPAAEGHRVAPHIEDREHHPGPEEVLQLVHPVDEGETGVEQVLPGELLLLQVEGQGVVAVGRPSDGEGPGHVAVEAPAAEVAAGDAGAGIVEQEPVVESDGCGRGLDEAVAALPVLGDGGVVVAEGDAGLGRQPLDGGGEVEVLDLPDEADGVAAGAAAEAVVQAELGVDRERRRLLGVEGAEPLVAAPDPLEGEVLGYDGDHVRRLPDPGHVLVEDPHCCRA